MRRTSTRSSGCRRRPGCTPTRSRGRTPSATSAGDGAMTLTVVGDGPMRDAVIERAAALGVAEKVTVRPGVPPEQVPEIYASHDVLVHLSSFETFGMTVVEAVGSGLPTIVT